MEENNRMPLIGDDAPSFKAKTTQGEINFPEDYKGKWVILFSHPADFTPVCTRRIKELQYKGMKDIEVTFPLIEDIKMDVANKFGMIQPNQSNTQAVRAVFVIDPKAKIRCILYYPLSTGRNFDEIKRIIIALQKADKDGIATPADWRPGDDVIVPPPGSCGTAKERMESTSEDTYCLDWFMCFKKEKK